MKRVLLLLCQGVEVYEAAALYDVLGWSREYGIEPVETVTAGLRPEVRGTFGIRLVPDMLLSDVRVDEFDALAVPGGFETYGYYEDAYSQGVVDLVRGFHDRQKPIASICVGALLVAHSGILQGRPATTYGIDSPRRRTQLAGFGARVLDQPLVVDGCVTTSSCPATALDVAFGLLSRLTGDENARIVRRLMGFSGPEASAPLQ